MKFSSAFLLASLSGASAFVQPAPARSTSSKFVLAEPEAAVEQSEAENKVQIEVDAKEVEAKTEAPAAPAVEAKSAPAPFFIAEKEASIEPGRYNDIDKSITLPFFDKPTNLDGSHAGDFGFDPLGLSQDFDLYYMQECEIRHARLAMLAVVGWPLSELVGPDFMLEGGRAPSVLNGVNPISGGAILAFLGAFSALEFFTWNRRTAGTELGEKHRADMKQIWDLGVAGDYNFDPAGFYNMLGDDAYGRKAMRQLEITQGRYAMLGISSFALMESLTKTPIVENNPFFHPNLFLPFAGVAYLAATTLYEFSDLTEYPIKIQKSRLGKEFDEWLERRSE